MRLTVLAALAALLVVAVPAEASFTSCTFSGSTVTATFGSGTTGTLRVGPGGAIQADGSNCGGATVTNTDKIAVIGTSQHPERLTIDLGGGPFAPGLTTGGAEGASPEIEFDVDLKSGNLPPDVVVLGTPGVDHVTVGSFGEFLQERIAINLNADEAGTVDADVLNLSEANPTVDVRGGGSGDFLGNAGGDGIPNPAFSTTIYGEAGADDLVVGDSSVPGPGNDTLHFVTDAGGSVSYFDAPGATVIAPKDGTGGDWGGAPNDGEGGSDVYDGDPAHIDGSDDAADVYEGSDAPDSFSGHGGADTIDGGGDGDFLAGGDGGDTIHAGGGPDDLRGGDGNDHLFGEGEVDRIEGEEGADEESGGDGDDRIVQTGAFQQPGPYLPNGADDIHGGGGIDSLEYGAPLFLADPPIGRDAPVSVDLDGVADDGASGEGDNVHPDVENVIGGMADDTLAGDGGANELRGWGGADTLRGGGGDDTLHGLGSMGFFEEQLEAAIDDGADTFDPGPGEDVVRASDGDDTIAARDSTADALTCGSGNDTGQGDRVDAIAADCEGIALPVEMPPDPPVTPPADPPVTPPPPPPPPPPPAVTPPAPRIAQILTLPSSRRCASRRKFTVRVRREIRGTVKRVTIFLNGRRVKTVTGSRIGLPIDLRGLPKGTIRVRLHVELTDGRTATDTRRYRTCATKKRKGRFG